MLLTHEQQARHEIREWILDNPRDTAEQVVEQMRYELESIYYIDHDKNATTEALIKIAKDIRWMLVKQANWMVEAEEEGHGWEE